MTKDEALKLALEALEYIRNIETDVASQTKYGQAEEIIRKALAQPEIQSTHSADCYKWHHQCAIAEVERLRAQPEQEPVAWRDVTGFESYEVSTNGDLRIKETGQIKAKNLYGAGYVKADLWNNGKRKQTGMHRLVAEAFLEPSNGREVNHKNGNKQDNRVSNLEWCTRGENINHNYYELKYRIKPICVKNIKTLEIKIYSSISEAVRDGFNSARIHECLSGKRKSHNGFVFEYYTPPQRKPLTDEEIILIVADCASSHQHTDIHFARAIEAAHGIKENT